MSIFERHVFVCENERDCDHPRGCCKARGGVELRAELKKILKERGLARRMRANGAGCLDQCEMGPVMVVYPEGVWYGGVSPADLAEIVDEHLVGGRVVTRLAFERDTEGRLVKVADATP